MLMKMNATYVVLSLLLVFCSTSSMAQVFYSPTGRGTGSGASWDNARAGSNLTTDLGNGSTAGNKTIYLSAGNYTIDAQVDLSGRNVTIQGGFPSNATGMSLSGYNPDVNRTILKPGGLNPAVSRFWGVALSGSGNVVKLKGFEATGFTVNVGAFLYYDGGDQNIPCSINLEELYLHHNGGTADGGAVFLTGFINGGSTNSIHVTKCQFEGNVAGQGAGLMLNGVFASDFANGGIQGGANQPFVIENSSFSNNVANIHGGGLYLLGSADVLVRNNSFCGNQGEFGGGLAMLNENRTTIVNNVFKGNKSLTTIQEWRSGAILNNTANSLMAGCLISNNAFYGNTPLDLAFSASNQTAVNNNQFSVGNFSQTYATNGAANINNPPASNSGNTFNVTDPLPGGCPTYSGLLYDPNGDSDSDGIKNSDEGGPNTDTDGDGIPDYQDKDSDNDGIPDSVEKGAGTTPADTDGDGIADFRDLDSDNDGINDVREGGGTATDTNGDGRADGTPDPITGIPASAGANGTTTPQDTDGDGAPDYKDLDSDNDSISDLQESGNAAALAADTNNDGVIDYVPANDTDRDGIMSAADGLPGAWGDGSDIAPKNTGPNTTDAPDYVNTKSDGATNDISHTPNAGKDANGDGKLDNASDTDKDGVADSVDQQIGDFGGLPAVVVGVDLTPIFLMAQPDFSTLNKSRPFELRIFNVSANTSSGTITVYITKPSPKFKIVVTGSSWTITDNGGYYTLTATSLEVAANAAGFVSIAGTVTMEVGVAKGVYTLGAVIGDGSGGETDNTNNSASVSLNANP